MSKADLILSGGRIFAGLKEGFVEAVAVAGGRVLASGKLADVENVAGAGTRRIDLAGRLAVPGLNDAHQHLTLVGLWMNELNLRADNGVRSIDELLSRIAADVRSKKPGEWITGRGYDQSELKEQRHPTLEELDRVAPNNPVYIKRSCGHIAMTNSLALKLGGITIASPDPQGGIIGRQDGRLTGLLSETAKKPVLDVMPKKTRADIISAIEKAGQALLAYGFTSASDMAVGMGGGLEDLDAFEEAATSGRLPVRTWMVMSGEPTGPCPAQAAYDRGFRFGREIGLLRYGGVKLFCDGTLGGATAAMTLPYVGQPDNKGLFCYPDDAEFHAGLKRFHDLGYQLAIHAIGDNGIEQTLSGMEKLGDIRGRRHRIEHCGFVRDDQIERMVKAGVLPAGQPVFIYEFGDLYAKLVGGDRADASYPFRKWIDAGLQPSASSDAPVCTIDPFHGLYALTARRTVHGTARGLDQRVSMAEAIHCYTYNAAYSAFAEGDLGRLVPGQLADIAVYSQDLFAAEPEAMRDETKCDLTILGGKVVYDRQGETGGAISAAE